jgi:predicted nucleic acid-binding protein
MVKALLDTNIIVDLLRKHPIAEQWLMEQRDLAVSRSVWLEVLQGVEDSAEQRRAITLLNDFELVELTVSDFDWATRQLTRYHLSHNVDAFDCLIAAPSYRLQLPLYTRNLKHFTTLLGKLAQQPYQFPD